MRSICLGRAVLVLLFTSAPASAATIITLSITDTNIYDTSTILFYDFTADGNGGGTLSFVRELDQLSDDFFLATVSGTQFSAATFVAYDGVVSPATELYRYALSGHVSFSSYSFIGVPAYSRELIGLSADTVIRTEGPATPAPEPASALVLLTGGAFALLRRARSATRSD